MLVGVLLVSEGAIVFGNEAGDAAVSGLDDVTDLIALGIDSVNTIAQERVSVLDDLDFVAGHLLCPRTGAQREDVGSCKRVRRCVEEKEGDSKAAKKNDACPRCFSADSGITSWPWVSAEWMYGFHSDADLGVFDVRRAYNVGCLPRSG